MRYSPDIKQSVLQLQAEGISRQDIANRLAVPLVYVHRCLKGSTLSKEQRRSNVAVGRQKTAVVYPEGTTDKILELHAAGVSRPEIAKRLGLDINKVISDIQRSTVRLTEEQKAAVHWKYTEEQISQVKALRLEGVSLSEISRRTGVSPGACRMYFNREGIVLNPEQRSVNRREYPQEIDDEIVTLRKEGTDRNQIAEAVGVPLSKVKTVLIENGIALSPVTAQENAYRAKLSRNGDCMADMRKSITEESRDKAKNSVTETWRDPTLRKEASERSLKYWDSLSEEELLVIASSRSGEKSGVFKNMLERNGVEAPERLMQMLADARGGECLGIYRGSKTEIEWKCSAGHTFGAIPNTVQQGHWCPVCSHTVSGVQLALYDYVKSLCPDALLNDRTVLAPKELDIYVPSIKFGLELDGLYWHSEAAPGFVRNRSRDKAIACHSAGLSFLMVFEDEWDSKQELVKAMVRWRLNKFTGTKLHARELELRKVEGKDTKEFFDRNHLDGFARGKWGYALYHENRMVMAATVRVNFCGEWEIARLATDYDFSVRGGATRIVMAIRKDLGDADLVTYSNNRLSSGGVYRSMGAQEITKTAVPSYYYTDCRGSRVWRFKCKRINDPAILARFPTVPHTEVDQAHAGVFSEKLFGDNRPLYRIEDCGHKKWKFGKLSL